MERKREASGEKHSAWESRWRWGQVVLITGDAGLAAPLPAAGEPRASLCRQRLPKSCAPRALLPSCRRAFQSPFPPLWLFRWPQLPASRTSIASSPSVPVRQAPGLFLHRRGCVWLARSSQYRQVVDQGCKISVLPSNYLIISTYFQLCMKQNLIKLAGEPKPRLTWG